MFVGWFVGLLVCWFVGLLVCWLVGWLVGWFVGWLVGGGDALLVGVLSEGGSSPDPISTSLETRCCYLAAQRDPIKSPMSISATTQCVILFVTGQLFL